MTTECVESTRSIYDVPAIVGTGDDQPDDRELDKSIISRPSTGIWDEWTASNGSSRSTITSTQNGHYRPTELEMRQTKARSVVLVDPASLFLLQQIKDQFPLTPSLLGVSGFGQFWVREIGVKKLLV